MNRELITYKKGKIDAYLEARRTVHEMMNDKVKMETWTPEEVLKIIWTRFDCRIEYHEEEYQKLISNRA